MTTDLAQISTAFEYLTLVRLAYAVKSNDGALPSDSDGRRDEALDYLTEEFTASTDTGAIVAEARQIIEQKYELIGRQMSGGAGMLAWRNTDTGEYVVAVDGTAFSDGSVTERVLDVANNLVIGLTGGAGGIEVPQAQAVIDFVDSLQLPPDAVVYGTGHSLGAHDVVAAEHRRPGLFAGILGFAEPGRCGLLGGVADAVTGGALSNALDPATRAKIHVVETPGDPLGAIGIAGGQVHYIPDVPRVDVAIREDGEAGDQDPFDPGTGVFSARHGADAMAAFIYEARENYGPHTRWSDLTGPQPLPDSDAAILEALARWTNGVNGQEAGNQVIVVGNGAPGAGATAAGDATSRFDRGGQLLDLGTSVGAAATALADTEAAVALVSGGGTFVTIDPLTGEVSSIPLITGLDGAVVDESALPANAYHGLLTAAAEEGVAASAAFDVGSIFDGFDVVQPSNTTACFAGEVQVLMADGAERAIAEVQVGDEVLAFDGLGALAPARVARTLVHADRPVYRLNGRGPLVTPEHPFLLADGRFREIGALGPGERLVLADGQEPGPRDNVMSAVTRFTRGDGSSGKCVAVVGW